MASGGVVGGGGGGFGMMVVLGFSLGQAEQNSHQWSGRGVWA